MLTRPKHTHRKDRYGDPGLPKALESETELAKVLDPYELQHFAWSQCRLFWFLEILLTSS
jgi:hypothetical protein